MPSVATWWVIGMMRQSQSAPIRMRNVCVLLSVSFCSVKIRSWIVASTSSSGPAPAPLPRARLSCRPPRRCTPGAAAPAAPCA
eukprot:4517645-Pyramimonas_sp.AAC.1